MHRNEFYPRQSIAIETETEIKKGIFYINTFVVFFRPLTIYSYINITATGVCLNIHTIISVVLMK